tara:strand:+ start:190386 stop:191168 length:783 start_codon:yes stop_codon:yes gene_type:complete
MLPRALNVVMLNRILVGVALIVVWQFATMAQFVGYDLLPPPVDVFVKLAELPFTGAFWTAVRQTLTGALLGLSIAALIGIPLGLIIGTSPAIDRATSFLIDLFRSWPIIALMPVLVLLFGASFKMKVIMVVLAAIWPILIQSIYGSRRIEPIVDDMLRGYNIGGLLRFTNVGIPNALPYVVTGLRISATLSILVSIGVEVLVSVPGMGYEISTARVDGASAEVIAYVLASGVLGLLFNHGFATLERWLLAWHPSIRERAV